MQNLLLVILIAAFALPALAEERPFGPLRPNPPPPDPQILGNAQALGGRCGSRRSRGPWPATTGAAANGNSANFRRMGVPLSSRPR
jgi:hypothetical protein